MAISVTMCMTLFVIMQGEYDLFFDILVQKQLGHVQMQHPQYAKSKSLHDTLYNGTETISKIQDLGSTKALTPRLKSNVLASKEEKSAGAQIVGIVPSLEMEMTDLSSLLIEGTYLSNEAKKETIVGADLAKELKLALEDELFVYTQGADGSMAYDLYTIKGVYRSGSVLLDKGAFVHLSDLQTMLVMEDRLHEILILTHSADGIQKYADDLSDMVGAVVPDEDADSEKYQREAIQVKTWWESNPKAFEMLELIKGISSIFLLIIFLIAIFGIINTMLMAVFERTKEIGVLRALGLKQPQVVFLIIVESFFLSLVAGAMGIALGGLLIYYLLEHGIDISSGTGEPIAAMGMLIGPILYPSIDWGTFFVPAIVLVFVSIFAALWPAIKAARLQPVEAIRSE